MKLEDLKIVPQEWVSNVKVIKHFGKSRCYIASYKNYSEIKVVTLNGDEIFKESRLVQMPINKLKEIAFARMKFKHFKLKQ